MRRSAQGSFAVGGLAALVLACSSSPPHEVLDADAAPRRDAGADKADADRLDARDEANRCAPSQLSCGGICVPNDFVNCGTCGNDCTNLHATSTPSCHAGQCAFPDLKCAAGWGHCTSNAADGCESDLSQPAHCGSCNNACGGSPVCALSAGAFSCSKILAAGVGNSFTLAVLANGAAVSWGTNWGSGFPDNDGQLGNGTRVESASVPGPVSDMSTVTAVAAGSGHACALQSNGTVECWGDNTWGQLGADPDADAGVTDSLTPIAVEGLSNVIAIAAGTVHTCALISGGTVECWGFNEHGELGNGTSTSCNGSDICSSTPVPVSGLSNVTAIAIGGDYLMGAADHTCALLANGTVYCWGYNADGELGNGTLTDQAPYGIVTPGLVSNLSNATAITARNEGACALLSGGGVECWGNNDDGELGDGMTSASATPVPVTSLTDAVALSVGSTANGVCAVRSNGAGVCWGQNGNGELGAGSSMSTSSSPLAISGLTNIAAIATGAFNACAVLATGEIKCWGSNVYGQVANATADTNINSKPLPVQW